MLNKETCSNCFYYCVANIHIRASKTPHICIICMCIFKQSKNGKQNTCTKIRIWFISKITYKGFANNLLLIKPQVIVICL